MQKVVETLEGGVIRVTTKDERFYGFNRIDPITKLPATRWKASVTWIGSFMYKGSALIKWVANKGYDEAQGEMMEKGARGSKIHNAIHQLLTTGSVKMEDKFLNTYTNQLEELEPDEYENVMFFKDWFLAEKRTIVFKEKIVEDKNDLYDIAGTLDLAWIDEKGIRHITDYKTGGVYREHHMQQSAYRYCLTTEFPEWKDAEMSLLQLGRKLNKRGWRETEVPYCFNLFLSVREIWAVETKDRSPLQRDMPVEILLEVQKAPLVGADAMERLWEKRGGRGEKLENTAAVSPVKPPVRKTIAKPIKK